MPSGNSSRATRSVQTSPPTSGVPGPPHWDSGSTSEQRQYSALGMRGGLGKTLLTAFLLLAIVPLGLLAFATYNQIQNDTRHKALASLETIVALEEAHAVDWADGCERELGLLAGLCGGIHAPDQACLAHAAAWLTETQAAALVLIQPGAEAVQVIAGQSEVLGEGPAADRRFVALRDRIAGGGMVTVPAAEAEERSDSASTSQSLLAIGHRLSGDEGYLVVLFPWQSLQRLIGTPSGSDQPDVTPRVSLAARDEDSGLRIYDFGETLSGQELEQRVESRAVVGIEQAVPYAELGTASDTPPGRGAGLYTNVAGVPVLGAYRWNPQLQVAILAEQPQAEVLAAGNTLTAVIVAVTLGMALVTAAIAALVTRQVTRPIVQLTETAARMARGDLDQQVAITRQDEIGVLARAFNRMAAELRVVYTDLNAKVEFLTNMSHALRTQLTSIIGFSRLMLKELDGPLTDLQRTDLAAIHEGGQQLLGLINDMLELSDLKLEPAPMTVDEVDLAEMVDGVMATARALALNKPVELVDEVAANLPTLYTDERRVRRVLLALMSNAIRITDEGRVRLSATVSDGRVTISIQAMGARGQAEIFDQSPGNGDLPPEADLSRSGLGLTLSRQMVEKLGGRIWVESNDSGVGRQSAGDIRHAGPSAAYDAALYDGPVAGRSAGSTFVFTLPISPSDMA